MIWFTIALCFAACFFPDLLLAADKGTNPTNNVLGDLPQIVAVIIALSVASERLVEIVKGFIGPLNEKYDANSLQERMRKVTLQIMAIISGIITAFLASPAISNALPNWTSPWHFLALGLLASGGSGFWNSFNTYVLQLKDLKKEEVIKLKAGTPSGASGT